MQRFFLLFLSLVNLSTSSMAMLPTEGEGSSPEFQEGFNSLLPALALSGFSLLSSLQEGIESEWELSEVDRLRGVQAPESLLAKAERILRLLKENYMSSEEYGRRLELSSLDQSRLYELDRFNQLPLAFYKRILISKLNASVIYIISKICLELFNKPLDELILQSAGVHLLKSGECGSLSHALSLELMKAHFPVIRKYRIEGISNNGKIKFNHAFLTVEDESGTEFALDPLLEIEVVPFEDYLKNHKLFDYFGTVLRAGDYHLLEAELQDIYRAEDYTSQLEEILNLIDLIKKEALENYDLQDVIERMSVVHESDSLFQLKTMIKIVDSSLAMYKSQLSKTLNRLSYKQ